MLIKQACDIKPSEITDKHVYLNRRTFLHSSALGVVGAAAALSMPTDVAAGAKLKDVMQSAYTLDEELTPYEDITSYNNFYEFGTAKTDPAANAHTLVTRPWSLTASGECENPGSFDLEDFISPNKLEERIYRLRCVERWSMVIPWVGVPLRPVLEKFKPTSSAKYVAFETLLDPEQMPGQRRRRPVLKWPYVEGLRIDEAMNELAFLAVGLYGEEMPNQNGAPIRLVIPWKYGYKSIKSIVAVRFTETQPPTSWNVNAPHEYGFYSNVNPGRAHPRWSQKKERRVGEFFKRPTLMFNGYAEQVANLYAGMDLIHNH